MSSETVNPISPTRFASALESLPLDALHAKAAELRNSLLKLKQSNAEMLPFAEAGDDVCREAMFENLGVIGRMNERIELLRVEVVEKRGMPWVGEDGEMIVMNGHGGAEAAADGETEVDGEVVRTQARPSGSLSDEELRRRLEAQMADQDGAEEEEEGVHL